MLKRNTVRAAAMLLITFGALGWRAPALAAEHGTAAEATALVKKAVAHLQASDAAKAYADFSDPAGAFRDRDLYIFVIDMDGLELANGANPKIIGKNVLDLKDADGNMMVKALIALARGKGAGWVDYNWPNPVSHTVDKKSAYVEKYQNVLVASGIYKK